MAISFTRTREVNNLCSKGDSQALIRPETRSLLVIVLSLLVIAVKYDVPRKQQIA